MAVNRRYLIVGPAWVGDMVMAQSLFITLKQQYPDASIDVVSPEWSVPLLERMPEVSDAISLPLNHGELALWKRYRTGRQLQARNYSHAIVIPRSYKSALIPFFAGIKTRTGYRGEMRYGILNDVRKLDKNILTQTVQRQVALAYSGEQQQPPVVPFPRLTVDKENYNRLLKELDLNTGKPVIGFMPGAEYGPAKQWPIVKYHTLASRLIDEGYQIWVYGSDKERNIGESIASGRRDIINLCGKTKLVDVVDLINSNRCIVSNDSGLMHIAAAVDTRLVAIYGSSTPAYTPPLTDKKMIIYLDLDCSPCFKRVCRYGHTNCLNNIEVNDVYEAIRKSLH